MGALQLNKIGHFFSPDDNAGGESVGKGEVEGMTGGIYMLIISVCRRKSYYHLDFKVKPEFYCRMKRFEEASRRKTKTKTKKKR